MNPEATWVVEYSAEQKQFHIDTLRHAIESNLETLNAGVSVGYLIIGVFPNQDEAHKFIKKIADKWERRMAQVWQK